MSAEQLNKHDRPMVARKLEFLDATRAADLTHAEFRVLIMLATYVDSVTLGNAFPSAATLAAVAQVSDTTLKKALRTLQAKGWIRLTSRGGNQVGKGLANVWCLQVPTAKGANHCPPSESAKGANHYPPSASSKGASGCDQGGQPLSARGVTTDRQGGQPLAPHPVIDPVINPGIEPSSSAIENSGSAFVDGSALDEHTETSDSEGDQALAWLRSTNTVPTADEAERFADLIEVRGMSRYKAKAAIEDERRQRRTTRQHPAPGALSNA